MVDNRNVSAMDTGWYVAGAQNVKKPAGRSLAGFLYYIITF
ncbi:hypothetical protein MuYL_1835 [Mucilaginibacter xinganensis]|uniref:Uncharacterized protein n=1 Tax=Mucilaginibacter xinganensis TaxID=1234841 RepID=A0A223NW16_9SPHI|nr:hypothetical protein MuYL_1835 [Mucilaginibacter xinganensis]